jgi:hypothetical protein
MLSLLPCLRADNLLLLRQNLPHGILLCMSVRYCSSNRSRDTVYCRYKISQEWAQGRESACKENWKKSNDESNSTGEMSYHLLRLPGRCITSRIALARATFHDIARDVSSDSLNARGGSISPDQAAKFVRGMRSARRQTWEDIASHRNSNAIDALCYSCCHGAWKVANA